MGTEKTTNTREANRPDPIEQWSITEVHGVEPVSQWVLGAGGCWVVVGGGGDTQQTSRARQKKEKT